MRIAAGARCLGHRGDNQGRAPPCLGGECGGSLGPRPARRRPQRGPVDLTRGGRARTCSRRPSRPTASPGLARTHAGLFGPHAPSGCRPARVRRPEYHRRPEDRGGSSPSPGWERCGVGAGAPGKTASTGPTARQGDAEIRPAPRGSWSTTLACTLWPSPGRDACSEQAQRPRPTGPETGGNPGGCLRFASPLRNAHPLIDTFVPGTSPSSINRRRNPQCPPTRVTWT